MAKPPPSTEIPKLLLSVNEAAASVGLSTTFLRREIDLGRLQAKRASGNAGAGGRLLLSPAALLRWFDELPDA